eukprot:c18538_g1_i1.p1 GENE.c18538_g1_i1~~c18538_g1_i1.p1  ORF type:complete len:187 (+),score=34.41 c18538_g1_i1:173-733(+)
MPCLCVLLRRKGKFTEYRNLDVIWKHPESGGKVFCGNLTAAQTKGILEEHGITHILNCQELKSRNYFEEDPNFTYGRMPVATWGGYSLQRKTDTIGNLLLQHLAFVQNAVAEGHNVLIHCLAGAHRAGTASVAFIMLSSRVTYAVALRAAQRCRPIINPFGHLAIMLEQFQQHLISQGIELSSELS